MEECSCSVKEFGGSWNPLAFTLIPFPGMSARNIRNITVEYVPEEGIKG